jgi:hypothetical protein
MKQDRRGSWYLLTGTVLGIAVGLVYSWVISPVRYIDAPPSALRADYKDDYRALIAAAYLYNLDLIRAQDRLAQLKDDDAAKTLTLQAQRALSEGHSDEEIYALNTLASAINASSAPGIKESTPVPGVNFVPMMDKTFSITLLVNQPTNPTAMFFTSPIPELSSTLYTTHNNRLIQDTLPTVTRGTPTTLIEKRLICNINQLLPLIQVEVKDAMGKPIPEVDVAALWENGEDYFFTGLQPELGMGYTDFTLSFGLLYSFHLVDEDSVESNHTAAECMTEESSRYWGPRYLVFTQT